MERSLKLRELFSLNVGFSNLSSLTQISLAIERKVFESDDVILLTC